MTTMVRLTDFLTPKQIRQAEQLWENYRPDFHQRVMKEVIIPNLKEINQKLNQENSAAYLAYAAEYVFYRAKG